MLGELDQIIKILLSVSVWECLLKSSQLSPPPLEIGLKESHINPKNPFKRGDPYFSEYTIVFNIQISAGFNG